MPGKSELQIGAIGLVGPGGRGGWQRGSALAFRDEAEKSEKQVAILSGMLSAKLGARTVKVPFAADDPVTCLRESLVAAFELPADANLRLLAKGKALSAEPTVTCAGAGLKAGGTLMVMYTASKEVEAVQAAKPERMRGFEEGDLRQATGGLAGSSSVRAAASRSASSPYRFHALQPLTQVPPGAKPAVSACMGRLRELSEDRAVLKLLEEHKWSIGKLSEMVPEGQVGVSESCLMGLNKNKGEEILLRLRTDDWSGLRPYLSVIDVLLHELAHCVHSDHDNDFKALWALLKMEYAQHRSCGQRGQTAGAADVYQPSQTDAAPSDGGHVLGGCASATSDVSPAAAAAAAAVARFGGGPMAGSWKAGASEVASASGPAGVECEECTMEE